LDESFQAASKHQPKLRFYDFKEFLEREEALAGFNLTQPLVQKLFSELDPHRKGYLNINDWRNSFKTFSSKD
jgi:Ca2+-binding EF-hand superfamily protein